MSGGGAATWEAVRAAAAGTRPEANGAKRLTITFVGTATPCQRSGETDRLITPQSRPCESTSGPPSEPGLTAAVVSMTSPS